MHKKLFLFSIFLLTTTFSFAQFKGGFYAGFNGSQVDGDNYAGYYKLGLNLSAAVEFPLSDYFGVSMEISYSQKGSQTKSIQGIPRGYFLKLDYAEVPLMINYHDQKKTTLCAGIGINSLVYYNEIIGPNQYGSTQPSAIRQLNQIGRAHV